jgi:DNA (cytosine-5)-methyltransferase 1
VRTYLDDVKVHEPDGPSSMDTTDVLGILTAWPGVSNLGDVREVCWAEIDPVDVVTAGFPCQDISSAGRRAGIGKGDRSGLWTHIVAAVRVLQPAFVVVENVAALRWKNGGLHRVLGDLAEAGYDALWRSVRASDIGAAHRRERVFLLGWPRVLLSATPVRDTDRPRWSFQRSQRCQQARWTIAARSAAPPTPATDWGQYVNAVRRWERALGRRAPAPTEMGRHGKPVLSAAFVEYLMGLPTGWVSDLPLPRTAKLRALGNGVVPQQAAYAISLLLNDFLALVAAEEGLNGDLSAWLSRLLASAGCYNGEDHAGGRAA